MHKNMITKIYWGVIALLLVIIGGFYLAIKGRNNIEVERAISSFVEAANAGAPRQVDEYTRLERVTSKGIEIRFEYSMKEYEGYNEENHKTKLQDLFRELVCKTPRFKGVFLENGATIHFRYNVGAPSEKSFGFSKENCN